MASYTIATHKDYKYITIVTIPKENIEKIDFAHCNEPTETPDAYYKRQSVKPDIITNGGFFNTQGGTTCFGFRDEGNILKGALRGEGVGIVDKKDLVFGHVLSKENVRDYVEAYPVFIKDGKKIKIDYAQEINYLARRTAIGWDSKNLYVVTVDSPGCYFSVLAGIFLELGATYAINLDGGGSTRMLVEGKRKTSQAYARPVDNVFCIYLKKAEPASKVYYRVQTGAFISQTKANVLAAELEAKGFTDIWVRKIGVYWKVQLGAFGVKLNAERLADRLKALGYQTYITTK